MKKTTVLVINAGSSSLKYACFEGTRAEETETARGQIERIGHSDMKLTHQGVCGGCERALGQEGGYAEAFSAMLQVLTDPEVGPVQKPGDLVAVGHRVVHGGDLFAVPTVIDDWVLEQIRQLGALAPLHNPVSARAIEAARLAFPDIPQVAVFDTAFHQSLPPEAYLYGLPLEYARARKIRRYGFHGTSYAYVSTHVAEYLGRPLEELALISCHLGNGSSVCAIDGGRSVDTSMGFTPTEGLIMGTRCGDIDPAVLTFLMRSEGMHPDAIDDLISRSGGLLGLSGVSEDMRELEAAARSGNGAAEVAIRTYCRRVRKYVGAYLAVLGRLDAIVFTAGIGQGSARVRELTLRGLEGLGIELDQTRNTEARGFAEICRVSTEESRVAVLVVPTREEWMIARLSRAAIA